MTEHVNDSCNNLGEKLNPMKEQFASEIDVEIVGPRMSKYRITGRVTVKSADLLNHPDRDAFMMHAVDGYHPYHFGGTVKRIHDGVFEVVAYRD